MATRNQVMSLFGLSPEQMIQQEQETRRQEIAAIQDPYQRSGALIGQQVGGMFGGDQESANVQRQRELYASLQGVNFGDPTQMRQAASMLQSQFPDRALQLLMMADDMETTAQQRATSAAQEKAAGIKNVPKFMGYKYVKTGVDQLGNDVYGTQPYYEDVPIPLEDLDKYYAGEGRYKNWGGSSVAQATTAQPDAKPEGLKRSDNARDIEGSVGGPVVFQDGKYYMRDDEGNPVGQPLTKEQLGQIGVKVPEPVVAETPIQAEKRAKVEQQITQDRLQQSNINPTGTVFDPNNPFAGGM